MRTRPFMKALPLLFALVIVSACSAPTAVPVAPLPAPNHSCSIVVHTGDGPNHLFEELGYGVNDKKPDLLVNGVTTSPSQLNPQPGDVISLINASNCSGQYIRAVQATFDENRMANYAGEWRRIGGFKNPIDAQRIYAAISQSCGDARWNQFSLRFNGDLQNGGCNYPTLWKATFTDGTTFCRSAATAFDAYNDAATQNLADMKSFIAAVFPVPVDEAVIHDHLCAK